MEEDFENDWAEEILLGLIFRDGNNNNDNKVCITLSPRFSPESLLQAKNFNC